MDARQRLAEGLRQARAAAHLTQVQAAEALGITPVTVSNHERGVTEPDEGLIVRYAELYDTRPEALRYGENWQRRVRDTRDLDLVVAGEVGLSQPVRTFLAETRLELTKGGASDEEIEEAMELLTAPQVRSYFMGGARRDRSEEDVLKGMRALVEAVIKPTLRELGRNL